MAKESIRKIREAEAVAAEIIAEAERSAADMLTIAEKRGKDHLESVTLECEAENRRKLDELRTKTAEMLEKTGAEAAESAKQLRKLSSPQTANAVKLIVQGIFEQCQ